MVRAIRLTNDQSSYCPGLSRVSLLLLSTSVDVLTKLRGHFLYNLRGSTL